MANFNFPGTQANENTPEYKTFRGCYSLLIDILQSSVGKIGDELFAANLITNEMKRNEHNLSDADTTRKLLDHIASEIKYNPDVYHQFVKVLSQAGSVTGWTKGVLERLRECYEWHTKHSVDSLAYFDINKVSFPHLDTRNLDEDQIRDLKSRINYETEQIMRKFRILVTKLMSSLIQNQKIDDIKHFLLNLPALNQEGTTVKVFGRNDQIKIENAESIREIFDTLEGYISFFNYYIIEDLATFGTVDNIKESSDYIELLTKFCRRNIFEVPPLVFQPKRPLAKVFTLKCENMEIVCTLNDTRKVIDKIAHLLNILPSTLQLSSINEGCVELQCMIPRELANVIFPVSPAQQLALNEMRVKVLCQPYNDIDQCIEPKEKTSKSLMQKPYNDSTTFDQPKEKTSKPLMQKAYIDSTTFDQPKERTSKPLMQTNHRPVVILLVLLCVEAAFIGGACVYMYSSMSKSLERKEGRLEFFNVPTINSPFFGRANELKYLKELIISNSIRIININGPPAFGKSRLANQLGHELLHYSDVIPNIRYIDTATFRKSFYLCSISTSQEHNRYSDTHAVADTESLENSGQGVYNDDFCTWIAWQKKRTVLIFDNCDPILHSNDRKLFVDMLQNFLSMNVQIFNVVVVSQEQLFLEDGFHSIHLEALSPMDSQAMLMHYVQNLTTAQADELHTVVGGCPLALKVVAKLLCKGKGLQWLLANLKRNVTLTLSKSTREEDQLHRVIDIAFKNYMNRQSRKCARILSLFPGSASEEMVNSVLWVSALSQIVHPDPLYVTRLLFLEEFSIEELRRFSIHTVIQSYLQSVHVIQSDVKAFNLSFLGFYSDYLTIAMKQRYMYAHPNVSDKDNYILNDLESHNMNQFVPILLYTDIDEEQLTLYSAIALGFLIHEKRIPDTYDYEVMLKAYYLYSRSSIFNRLCAYSSKEVCTSIFSKSFSVLEEHNGCNSYFSYISNFFFTHPICSQLYNCSNDASSYTCKLITKLQLIWTFLNPTETVLLIIICFVPIVYRGITSCGFVVGLLLATLVLYFPWTVNFYVWCQLYFGLWYNTCISISYYVEEWQCTHLPTSFINNTMSDMCNNTTSIVEEHGMFLVILSMGVPLFATAMISNITNNRDIDGQIIMKCFFLNLGILMFGCSVVSRLITSLTIFYITYILINMLPLLFCYICYIIIHYKNTLIIHYKNTLIVSMVQPCIIEFDNIDL